MLEDYAADAKLKFQTCLPKSRPEIVTVSRFVILSGLPTAGVEKSRF
jgi:hypothetical protein